MTAGLADALRHGTHALHREVERSACMQCLLRGQMPQPAYALLLRNLHHLYAGLEAALSRHQAHALLAPLHDPQAVALRRPGPGPRLPARPRLAPPRWR